MTERELIYVDKAFLIAAMQDARSWCHEMEVPGATMPTSGRLADYDAALGSSALRARKRYNGSVEIRPGSS